MSVDMSKSSDHMDRAQHERTYNLFIGLFKYGAGFIVLILLGMAFFLI